MSMRVLTIVVIATCLLGVDASFAAKSAKKSDVEKVALRPERGTRREHGRQ